MRRFLLVAALALSTSGLVRCGLDDLDYTQFQVSCARERCPADYCCDAESLCDKGSADDLGLCPGVTR
jgi:hypothetical protein